MTQALTAAAEMQELQEGVAKQSKQSEELSCQLSAASQEQHAAKLREDQLSAPCTHIRSARIAYQCSMHRISMHHASHINACSHAHIRIKSDHKPQVAKV